MRFCTSCGSPVDRPFCTNCGAPTRIATGEHDRAEGPEVEQRPVPEATGAQQPAPGPPADTPAAPADVTATDPVAPVSLPDEPVAPVSDPDGPVGTSAPSSDRSTKRRRLIIANIVLAVILVVVVVVLLVIGLGGGGNDTAADVTSEPTTSTAASVEPADEPVGSDDVVPPSSEPVADDSAGGEDMEDDDAGEIAKVMESVGDLSVGPVNIVLPVDVSPPAMPTSLDGWRQSGALESTEVRVFEGEPYSYPSDLGATGNRCGDLIWTARWRIANPDVLVRAGVEYEELVRTHYDSDITYNPTPGGAGFISASICETPVFTWESTTGEGNLADVLIEYQFWEPAV